VSYTDLSLAHINQIWRIWNEYPEADIEFDPRTGKLYPIEGTGKHDEGS